MADITGSSVEHNKFCVSVHFRNCDPDDYPAGACRHAKLAGRRTSCGFAWPVWLRLFWGAAGEVTGCMVAGYL